MKINDMRPNLVLAAILAPLASGAHDFAGPHGTVVIDWTLPEISRVLSSGYGDSFGMEAWARDGFPEPVVVEGRQCYRGTGFLFDVDDDFAFDIDETVSIELTFDRTESAGMLIAWDQNAVAENLASYVIPPSEARWHTLTVELGRARFANRGESGSDFVVAAPDGTWFGDPAGDHKFVLCDVRVSRSHETPAEKGRGRLRLAIRDEHGDPVPARVGLYDETGRMPLPSDDALTVHNYTDRTKQLFLRNTHGTVPVWPHDNRYFFYVDGMYEAALPAGNYALVVSKGPEYRILQRDIRIEAGEDVSIEMPLVRWTDMPGQGWYSGDGHVHMTRRPEDNVSIINVMQAEDVHVTNLLQMGNPYDTHFTQYAFGPEGRFREGGRALVPGVEDPRTAIRGHTISLNIRAPYRPAERYLRYDRIFAEYRRQGGLSGYAHVAGRLFNVERGLAIDVPLGAVDFVELLQDGVLETGLWYDFLNLGFRLIPVAGSDFPYLSAPGGERNYVYLGDDFSIDDYYAALREARTFVTNGPMLRLSVNGHMMGETLELAPGDELVVEAHAALNPDVEPLDRLELVVHGDVVAVAGDLSADNTLELFWTAKVVDGSWLAIRAYGARQTVAHSAPVYVTTGAGFGKRSAVPAIARRMMSILSAFETVEANRQQELEAWSVGAPLTRMLEEQRGAILERADEARARYARMIDAN